MKSPTTRRWIPVLVLACLAAAPAVAQHERPLSKRPLQPNEKPVVKPEVQPDMELLSTAFADNGRIPPVFTCEGMDLSPPLAWRYVPEGTESFVLICDDPDAPHGTWHHWLVVDIPGSQRGWPEGLSDGVKPLPGEARHGLNSWGRRDWGGPCPPPGPEHHYEFTLYALSAPLQLPDASLDEAHVLDAMRGVVLAEARLTGTYSR